MIKIHPKNKRLKSIELETLYLEQAKKYPEVFHKLGEDVVFARVGIYQILAYKEDIVEVVYSDNENTKILKPYVPESTYKIDGVLYDKRSPLICQTNDTERVMLIKDAFESYDGFYEHKDNLIYLEHRDKWVSKKKAVLTKDTLLYEHRRNTVKSDNGDYFRYREMSYPIDKWRRAPYTSESLFPKEIKERRIGLEYEFGDTFSLFKNFLAGNHKFVWDSVRDGSLDNISQGIEFVSIPLKLEELSKGIEFIDFCKKEGAGIYPECGFHVHIGASDFSFMDLTRMVQLGLSIESDMFKLGGKDRAKNTYCKSLSDRFKGFTDIIIPKDKNKVGKKLYSGMNAKFEERHNQSKYVDARNHTGIRYYWLNIDRFFYMRNSPEKRTIEFRNHKATWDSKRFENYALLCYYIVEYAKNHGRKTCSKATLYDIVNTSKLIHRKRLIKYLDTYLNN